MVMMGPRQRSEREMEEVAGSRDEQRVQWGERSCKGRGLSEACFVDGPRPTWSPRS